MGKSADACGAKASACQVQFADILEVFGGFDGAEDVGAEAAASEAQDREGREGWGVFKPSEFVEVGSAQVQKAGDGPAGFIACASNFSPPVGGDDAECVGPGFQGARGVVQAHGEFGSFGPCVEELNEALPGFWRVSCIEDLAKLADAFVEVHEHSVLATVGWCSAVLWCGGSVSYEGWQRSSGGRCERTYKKDVLGRRGPNFGLDGAGASMGLYHQYGIQ